MADDKNGGEGGTTLKRRRRKEKLGLPPDTLGATSYPTHSFHGGIEDALNIEAHYDKILRAWRKTVDSNVETGQLLTNAKAALGHGNWLKVIRRLPFGIRVAQMLMNIARNTVVTNAQFITFFPASYATDQRAHSRPAR